MDAWVTFRQGWMAAGDAHALPVVRHFHRHDVLPRAAADQAEPPSARPAQHEWLRVRGVRTFGIPMRRRMSVAGWGRAGGCALGRVAPTALPPSAPPDTTPQPDSVSDTHARGQRPPKVCGGTLEGGLCRTSEDSAGSKDGGWGSGCCDTIWMILSRCASTCGVTCNRMS